MKRRPIFLAYHTDTNILPERWTPTSVQTESAQLSTGPARGRRGGEEEEEEEDVTEAKEGIHAWHV